MHVLWMERHFLVLNLCGQPIGPTEEIVKEFTRFLGTLAKNSELATFNYVDWPSLPIHDKIWVYVQDKYMVPEEGKKWVMMTLNLGWRIHKCRMKKKHYYACETDEERWEKRPKTMPESQFKVLLKYWHISTVEEESKMNKRNRESLDDMYTMGPNSYAMLRHKLDRFTAYCSKGTRQSGTTKSDIQK